MADLPRAGRYDRMSNDVLTLTGKGRTGVGDFVSKNAATFTPAVKRALRDANLIGPRFA